LPQKGCFIPLGFKHVEHEKVRVKHFERFKVAQTCHSKYHVRAEFMFVYENLEFCITVVVVVFYVTARFRANQMLTANL
jgi:hypothetical protein